ncbi:MAG: cell division protein FtsW, partial [Alphaproteobacteria bacterium]|nr:cell division protein FtsW [Alphaproteobacteria bacterium]
MLSRAERNLLSDWRWTVDRWFLGLAAALIVFGFVLILAGSPAVAERHRLPPFHFVNKQIWYLGFAICIMICVSFFSPRMVRRLAAALFFVSLGMIFAALVFGVEIKGSRRWIAGLQPSEFLKPAFVILAAWAFSEGARRKDVPANWIAFALLPAAIIPLMLQPDFGQTMLISLVWAGLFFTAGLHWLWVAGIGGLGTLGVFGAYHLLPHVRNRIDKFIDPSSASAGVADTFQVDMAMESFKAGGWFGRGPGEGTFKRILPDSHTDFIFAVTGEEFGVLACLLVAGLFAA